MTATAFIRTCICVSCFVFFFLFMYIYVRSLGAITIFSREKIIFEVCVFFSSLFSLVEAVVYCVAATQPEYRMDARRAVKIKAVVMTAIVIMDVICIHQLFLIKDALLSSYLSHLLLVFFVDIVCMFSAAIFEIYSQE